MGSISASGFGPGGGGGVQIRGGSEFAVTPAVNKNEQVPIPSVE